MYRRRNQIENKGYKTTDFKIHLDRATSGRSFRKETRGHSQNDDCLPVLSSPQ